MRPLLDLIDWIVGKWIAWRTDQHVRRSGLCQELGIKSFDAATNSLVVSHPVVLLIADEMGQFLLDSGAPNYVQFDMLPRIDRHLDPIRVTVQWAKGLSPSEKVIQLSAEIDRLKAEIERGKQ